MIKRVVCLICEPKTARDNVRKFPHLGALAKHYKHSHKDEDIQVILCKA